MNTSSSRFKSLAVTAGLSFWFFIITTSIGIFSIEILLIFVGSVLITTQIFSRKISRVLDVIAIVNTKVFLGIFFVVIISIYGILFKLLKTDLLRLRKRDKTYWLNIEPTKPHRIRKQY